MGLMFASYARRPQPFTRMLEMMFRRDADGNYDHLLNYSRPVNGASLFAPSVDFLNRMAKAKTVYSCTECGAISPKWQGQCPGCGQWNTLVEVVQDNTPSRFKGLASASLVQ